MPQKPLHSHMDSQASSISSVLMTGAQLNQALEAMTEALVARLSAPSQVAIVGIRTGGIFVGQRLAKRLSERLGFSVPFGSLDITLYRDDLYSGLEKPRVGPTEILFDVDGREIVLVDDVLFTGRTVRAALEELMDLGRPRRILLATLLDRGHRELPIAADVVGLVVQTTREQRIAVQLAEDSRYGVDQVLIVEPSQRG